MRHRAPREIAIDAWSAAHTSEEYAAIARELRRLHVEDGVGWGDLAVVVRRQGSHVGGLLRALDDARDPALAPESGVSLAQEPATRPYVLALRWLVAGEDERDGLVESLLVSDLVRLSPAAARGLLRVAHVRTGAVAKGPRVLGRAHGRGGRAGGGGPRRPRAGGARRRSIGARHVRHALARAAVLAPSRRRRRRLRRRAARARLRRRVLRGGRPRPAPPPTRRSRRSSRRSTPASAARASRRGSVATPTPSRS